METTTGISVTAGMEVLSSLVSCAQAWINRSAEGREIADHILSSAARVIVFYGKSGCGKSEIFRRWVLPLLPEDRSVFYSSTFDTPPALERRGDGESEFWSATALPSLIVLDQFEGFFSKDAAARTAFLQQLSERLRTGRFEAVLILVLTEESLSDLITLREYLPQILDDVSKIGSVPAEEIRGALRSLATQHGLQIEDAALNRLVDDLRKPEASSQAVSPELLGALILEIWRSKSLMEGKVFGPDDYQAAGELNGMLRNYLEYTLDALLGEENRGLADAILQEVVLAARAKNAPDFEDLGKRFDAEKSDVDDVVGRLLRQSPRILHGTAAHRYAVIPAQLKLVIEEDIELEQQRSQQSKSLLRQAVRVFHARGVRLTDQEFNRLHRQRSSLRVTEEESELMLSCALVYEDIGLAGATRHWLCRAADETAKVEILLGGVFDRRNAVRERAAALLGDFDRPEVRNQLYLVALRDPEAEVRDRAIESLNKLKDERLRQSLFQEIRDPNSPSPGNAISALRIFPDKTTVDYLGNLVAEANPPSLREKAIRLLGDLQIPEALDILLVVAIRDADDEDRKVAAEVLGRTQGDSLELLLERVRDEKRLLTRAQRSLVHVPFPVRAGTFVLAAMLVILNFFVHGLIPLSLRRLKLGFALLALEVPGVGMLIYGSRYSMEVIQFGGMVVFCCSALSSQLAATWIVLREREPDGATQRSYIASLRLGLFLADALSFFLVFHGLAHAMTKRVTKGAKLFAYELVGIFLLACAYLFDPSVHERLYLFYLVMGLVLFLYSYFADVSKVLVDAVLFRAKNEFRRRIEIVYREMMKNPEACQLVLRRFRENQGKEIRQLSRIVRRFAVESQPLVAPLRQLWGPADPVARRRMASVLAAHKNEESIRTLRELTAEMGWAAGLRYLYWTLRYRVLPSPLLRIAALSLLVLVGSLSFYEAKLGPRLATIRLGSIVKDKSKPIERREQAAMRLAEEDPEEAVDSVRKVLDSDEPVAAKVPMLPSLGEIALTRKSDYPKQAHDLLGSLARQTGYPAVRQAALLQLQHVAMFSEIEALRAGSITVIYDLLKNSQEDLTLRTTALKAFQEIGTAPACDKLRAFVTLKPAREGAKAAEVGIGKITLDDVERSLREQAITALTRVKDTGDRFEARPDPVYAFRVLQSLANNARKDFDSGLRDAAMNQVRNIDPLVRAQSDLNQGKYQSTIEEAKGILRSEPDLSRSDKALEILQSSYSGLIEEDPDAPGLWDNVIKDLKDSGNLNKKGCDALALAYYRVNLSRGGAQKAAAELAPLQKRCPGSIQPGLILAFLYHEELAPVDAGFYAKAYEVLNTLPLIDTSQDERISAQANLDEASLTTGRYDQTRSLSDEILKNSALTQHKDLELNVRFFLLASLVLQQDKQGSDRQLKELLVFYRSLPDGFSNTWDFRGTRSFVERSKVPTDQEDLLLSTLDLIGGTKSQQKLDRFYHRVPGAAAERKLTTTID